MFASLYPEEIKSEFFGDVRVPMFELPFEFADEKAVPNTFTSDLETQAGWAALPFADSHDEKIGINFSSIQTGSGLRTGEMDREALTNSRIEEMLRHLRHFIFSERADFVFPYPSHSNRNDDVRVRWPDPNRKSIDLQVEKYTGDKYTCSLCLEEICDGSDIYRLICNHIFHAHNCIGDKNIKDWINDNGTCPYCRTKTHPEPETQFDLDVETVMSQASVSREVAVNALKKHRNIVDAILECVD